LSLLDEEAYVFTFSALIYDGYKQQLVTGDYEDKAQFDAFLNTKFGVHVCMWTAKEPTQKVIDVMLQATLVTKENASNKLNLKAKYS
jgi:phage-related protein